MMTPKNSFSSCEILSWRTDQLAKGGDLESIDWLLDNGGGLGWSELQKLKLFQNKSFLLHLSLKELAIIWSNHIDNQKPLQYLLGKCSWRDFELQINSSALIPRPETELVIDIALSKVPRSQKSGIWADLGTGAGPLAIALARSLKGWVGHAVDCSKNALSLARKNSQILAPSSKVIFHLGNWWEPLKTVNQKFDLVVSNPPYIPISDLKDLDPIVRDNEPHIALSGGLDGMDHCRSIIQGSINHLSPGGWLIFEHHFDQSDRALDLLIKAGFIEVDFKRDLQGIKRFALGRKPD